MRQARLDAVICRDAEPRNVATFGLAPYVSNCKQRAKLGNTSQLAKVRSAIIDQEGCLCCAEFPALAVNRHQEREAAFYVGRQISTALT